MARRTRTQIIDQRVREWAYIVTHWYAGNRVCSRCGRFTYCAGRSYEKQRCRRCFIGDPYKTNGNHNHDHVAA